MTHQELGLITKQMTQEDSWTYLMGIMTKKQILEICPDIADYEGSNWTKLEGIKHIVAPYYRGK